MFSERDLLPRLQAVAAHSCCVAFSGGMDSAVLLHACSLLRDAGQLPALSAVHVHHGLQKDADAWVQHCETFCAQRGVPLTVLHGQVEAVSGQGLESAARALRYRLFTEHLAEGACLLQAHHADDQAETFLLRALRGAGVRGLAAIPRRRALGRGGLLRPLLDIPRADLRAWAESEQLQWVEDPSNQQTVQDRNYLRHEILPALRRRWPGVDASLVQAATQCTDAEEIVRLAATAGLRECRTGAGGLQIAALLRLGAPLQREVLRSWALEQGLAPPGGHALRRIQEEIIPAGTDAEPLVCWPDAEARRFGPVLYLSVPLPPPPVGCDWQGESCLDLGPGCGMLHITRGAGRGLDFAQLAAGRLRIGFRSGGESCHPAGRSGSHALKKVFQELHVAPWLRDRVPLLLQDDQVLAAANLFYDHERYTTDASEALRLRWIPAPAWSAPLEQANLLEPIGSD